MFTQHQLLSVLLLLPIVLLLFACASAHYTVHPGALNALDSAAYDALLVAETTIDEARVNVQTGQLPDSAKDALTKLIAIYNLARESWLTYRGALTTNEPAQVHLDQLNKNLVDLARAIQNFQLASPPHAGHEEAK
jgi:hypothetical protein